MAVTFTSNELNVIRDLVNGRIVKVRLFDDTNTQRYDAAIQSKTVSDRRILITQALLSNELNGYNITTAQVINQDGSISAAQAFVPSLDKRPTSPTFNLPVNLTLTYYF